jgi:predicted acylesterase/phospholipase RssA
MMKMCTLRWSAAPVLALLLTVLAGCASAPRVPFTAAERAAASPAGFDNIRYAEEDTAYAAMLRAVVRTAPEGDLNLLAISGGGANGAFGAGLLNGWSTSGKRPVFQIVTGVSTGALTAPFAFLGAGWDTKLRRAYTAPATTGLLKPRSVFNVLGASIFHNGPLEQLVRGYVTDDMLRAIAAEHAKGRRLLVATTDLDTQQLIVWDMGAIAAHGGPDARRLFAQVLVASASLPGVFSPTLIPVRSGQRTFSEMHVDGQAEGAFFAIPPSILSSPDLPAQPASRVHLYVIVNGTLNNVFAVTPRGAIPVVTRTFDAANKAAIRNLLTTTLVFCRVRGCALSFATLPATVIDNPLDFGAPHLQALFAAGEAAGAGDQAWQETLP